MIVRPPLRLVSAALFALLASTPAEADRAFSVWWSPLLDLASLSALDSELARPFERPLELGKGDRAAVNDCLDLTRRAAQGYLPADQSESEVFSSLSGHCWALAALREARPARASYLRDFTMTSGAMDVLPAMVGVEWCFDQLGRVLEANREGVSWSDFVLADPWSEPSDYRVVAADPTSIVVERIVLPYGSDVRHERRVAIFGRGDFNGDEVDDLLLRTDWRDGADVGTALYVVSRLDRDLPLRVVATWGPQPHRATGCDRGDG
jgi:hypothetical protein